MPRISSTLIIAFLVLVVSTSAVSAGPDGRREKRRERIETLTMWKMMEALDLDKATSDKIFAIRRKYLKEKSRLRKAVKADIDRLGHLLGESRQVPADDDLRTLVNSIFDNRKKLRELWEKQYLEVSQVLTVRQQAVPPRHANVVNFFYPAPEALGGVGGFLGHRDVGRAGGNDQHA